VGHVCFMVGDRDVQPPDCTRGFVQDLRDDE